MLKKYTAIIMTYPTNNADIFLIANNSLGYRYQYIKHVNNKKKSHYDVRRYKGNTINVSINV